MQFINGYWYRKSFLSFSSFVQSAHVAMSAVTSERAVPPVRLLVILNSVSLLTVAMSVSFRLFIFAIGGAY